jgi:hypothetical protein
MPGERILFLMEPLVSTGYGPVLTLRHGRILSERNAPQLAGRVRDSIAAGEVVQLLDIVACAVISDAVLVCRARDINEFRQIERVKVFYSLDNLPLGLHRFGVIVTTRRPPKG